MEDTLEDSEITSQVVTRFWIAISSSPPDSSDSVVWGKELISKGKSRS